MCFACFLRALKIKIKSYIPGGNLSGSSDWKVVSSDHRDWQNNTL